MQAVYRSTPDEPTQHHMGCDHRWVIPKYPHALTWHHWRQGHTAHITAARRFANQLAAQLPPLPAPWDVDRLCRDLAKQHARALTVHEETLPAGVTGLWFNDGTRDYILVHAPTRGIYRDHIILHEIAHMLAGHGSRSHVGAACDLVDDQQRGRIDIEELVAEQFASIILHRVHRCAHYTTPLEHRAANAFGATNA